jgi:hypothetical protein
LPRPPKAKKNLLEICVSLRMVLALEGVECLMAGGNGART